MSNLVVLLTNVLAVEKDNVKEQFNTDLLLLSKKNKKKNIALDKQRKNICEPLILINEKNLSI